MEFVNYTTNKALRTFLAKAVLSRYETNQRQAEKDDRLPPADFNLQLASILVQERAKSLAETYDWFYSHSIGKEPNFAPMFKAKSKIVKVAKNGTLNRFCGKKYAVEFTLKTHSWGGSVDTYHYLRRGDSGRVTGRDFIPSKPTLTFLSGSDAPSGIIEYWTGLDTRSNPQTMGFVWNRNTFSIDMIEKLFTTSAMSREECHTKALRESFEGRMIASPIGIEILQDFGLWIEADDWGFED